jgi:2-methylcitrate dehydratase PrpD
MKPSNISPHMHALSTYIARAVRKAPPKAVVDRARLHLVDTFGAMISGTRLLPGAKAIEYARSLGGKLESGLVGTGMRMSAAHAALANGMFGHADETDDTHPPSQTHPGTSVVPAALAIGERNGLSGREVLRAIILGYDVCARMLLAFKPQPFMRSGHHSCAFGQLFGAAAAAASLLKLDARQVRHVLSYTAQQAAGLYTNFRDHDHIEKAYMMGGMPAHNGTQAALMVEPDPDSAVREELARGLGEDYEILRASIKRWPVGGPIQGPLHVLREMMSEHRFTALDVASLAVRMPDKELEIVNNRDMPDISVQHLLALMLLDGAVTFASAHDYARLRDRRVLNLRKRIEAIGDPTLTDPQRRWRAVIDIVLKDGRRLHHQTMAAKGMFENPLTPEEENEKVRDLIVPILGANRAQRLIEALWRFDTLADIRELRALYRA